MSGNMNESQLSVEFMQIIAIGVAMLVVGITIGMYTEKIFNWKNKKNLNFEVNSKLTAEQKEMLKTKPAKV